MVVVCRSRSLALVSPPLASPFCLFPSLLLSCLLPLFPSSSSRTTTFRFSFLVELIKLLFRLPYLLWGTLRNLTHLSQLSLLSPAWVSVCSSMCFAAVRDESIGAGWPRLESRTWSHFHPLPRSTSPDIERIATLVSSISSNEDKRVWWGVNALLSLVTLADCRSRLWIVFSKSNGVYRLQHLHDLTRSIVLYLNLVA